MGDSDGYVSLLQRQTGRFVLRTKIMEGQAGQVLMIVEQHGDRRVHRYSTPTFNDINKDGLMDLIMGTQSGSAEYWKNTGSTGSLNSAFTKQTGSDDPFAGINIGEYAAPIFYDMDDDGDDDLIIGGANGKLNYFERMGCVPNIVCNNRGLCAPNDVDGLLPVCKCSTADAIGNQCEFCAPGFVESKKIGALSLGSQIGVVCTSCVAGFWSGTTSFGVSVADSASAADAVARKFRLLARSARLVDLEWRSPPPARQVALSAPLAGSIARAQAVS